MKTADPKQAPLALFSGLKKYSRADVAVLNRLADLFHAGADWSRWIEEGFGSLLEVPGRRQITLEHGSSSTPLEAGKGVRDCFEREEITIGRDPGNDVVLTAAGVGRRHARISWRSGTYFIEDMGSANGTFLNDSKLRPGEAVPIDNGARFVIFPEQFVFSSEQAWGSPEQARVAGGTRRFSVWNPPESGKTQTLRYFTVKVMPDAGQAVLGVSKDLLKTTVQRISRANVNRLVPADDGIFEFAFLSVIERANRDLQFPFRFALVPFEPPKKGDVGIAVEGTIGFRGLTGAVELFLPANLLQEITRAQTAFQPLALPVNWELRVSKGHADLSLEELADLETGDVLLIANEPQLLLPPGDHSAERGWHAVEITGQTGQLRIENYFERSELTMAEEEKQERPGKASEKGSDAAKPNLAALPVRVHVVLSQLEMTLADLNKLTPGSIVEIGRDKTETVQLAVNGKIAGTAELVEIDGRLGVRIASWAAQ